MQNNLLKKGLAGVIILLFIGAGIIPSTVGIYEKKQSPKDDKTPFMGFNPRGDILYVGGTGPNNYTHIQDAIDDASDGDTVFVYDYSSPYYENVAVDKSIDLIGENMETTVIDGSETGDVVHISSNGVNVTGFTIQNCEGDWDYAGVDIPSDNNTISNCKIINNPTTGTNIDGSNNQIIENLINSNNYGIYIGYLLESNGNVVQDNTITDNYRGIRSRGPNNQIIGNQIGSNTLGLILEASDNIIQNNSIVSNEELGISIGGPRNHFYNNTISGNHEGIRCEGEDNYVNESIFKGNTIVNNDYYGIIIVCSFYDFTIVNNTLDDGILLLSINSGDAYGNTITDNTVNGDPLIYKEDESYITIEDESAGQVILVNCDNITVDGFDLSNTCTGVQLIDSNDCIISNHTFNSMSRFGVSLINSDKNMVQDNSFSDIIPEWGGGGAIYLRNSNSNTMKNNDITNIIQGFELQSSNQNLICDNNIDNFRETGILAYDSCCDNRIESNTINGDLDYQNTRGIYLYGYSSNNNISYNNISDNWVGVTIGMKTPASNTTLYMNTFENCVFDFQDNTQSSYTSSLKHGKTKSNNNHPTRILKNNFMGLKLFARFQVADPSASFTTWQNNYWGRFKLLPKLIIGLNTNMIPVQLKIDWHPARKPYEI